MSATHSICSHSIVEKIQLLTPGVKFGLLLPKQMAVLHAATDAKVAKHHSSYA